MDIHDGLLREHVMSLRRLRRFVLDGNLVRFDSDNA